MAKKTKKPINEGGESSEDEDDHDMKKPMNEVAGTETLIKGRCTVCAKLPFRGTGGPSAFLMNSREELDVDFGLFEIVNKAETPVQVYKIDRGLADRTAESAYKHLRNFRRQLTKVGLLQERQNFSGESKHARVVAPFAASEINLGRLLGSGGFSSVYEVQSFHPDQMLSAGVTKQEDASRKFITEHAGRKYKNYTMSKRQREQGEEYEICRYAVKHLRHQLTQNPERFERAAIDLILEGQLLLSMDHPHIIGIRGWSYEGPDAFRSRLYSDYFLILDRLPDTLISRMEEWRGYHRKYRSRLMVPWTKKKAEQKIIKLFRMRLQIAHDIASAIEYMHDRRIINRDIKAANIGFDVHGDLKVFDFGLSRLLPDESHLVDGGYEMSAVGTKLYMAPEVRNNKPYNLSADTYSFGVVFWQLLALSSPKDNLGKKSREHLEESGSDECWLPLCACWPNDVRTLLQSCLKIHPRSRPFMSEVCQDLKGYLSGTGAMRAKQRRRSTFRLDLTEQNSVKESKMSVESRTSRMSSCLDSDVLMDDENSQG